MLPVDLTSMVDLVFLLIIFFLTTSTFIEQGKAQLELPKQKGENLQERTPSGIIINISRNGTYIVSGEYLSLDALIAKIAAELADVGGDPSRLDLVLRADRNASLTHMNRLARRLIEMNVRQWKLATVVPRGAAAPTGHEGGV